MCIAFNSRANYLTQVCKLSTNSHNLKLRVLRSQQNVCDLCLRHFHITVHLRSSLSSEYPNSLCSRHYNKIVGNRHWLRARVGFMLPKPRSSLDTKHLNALCAICATGTTTINLATDTAKRLRHYQTTSTQRISTYCVRFCNRHC